LVCTDATLDTALDNATRRLRQSLRHEETLEALEAARALAASPTEPSPEALGTLGEGWVAEEALAIGVYCALVARDFEQGVLLAVNHSGDSDSTGAIAGNILGAVHGYNEIPAQWIDDLEMHEVIESLCRDWNAFLARDSEVELEGDETWWNRYPGWGI
jgi:ADP-ribosylglycohydrolase